MDLSDALGDWPNSNQNNSGGGAWPGQPSNPMWPSPSQPSQPSWPPGPGQPSQPSWPPGPGQPSQPAWPPGPGQPSQPSQPTWPGPSQPSQPTWPGPSQPSQPSHPSHPSGPAFPTAPQLNLAIPFSYSLPQGLQDKKLITVGGLVKHNPKKFMIDLGAGKDIVFHFNPRFNEGGKQVIVRNSQIGGRWGTEERELRHFPFAAGRSFEIKILVTPNTFKVAVDGAHLLEFRHRMSNLRAINSVHIFEDVTLTKFTVEDLR